MALSFFLAAPMAAQAQASLQAAARVIDTSVPAAALESTGRLLAARFPRSSADAIPSSPRTARRRDLGEAAVYLTEPLPGAGTAPDPVAVTIVYW